MIYVAPHPLLPLLRPPPLQPVQAHLLAELAHHVPHLRDALSSLSRGHRHSGLPARVSGTHVLERGRVLGFHPPGGGDEVAVALVHHDQVALFHDATLQTLELITACEGENLTEEHRQQQPKV